MAETHQELLARLERESRAKQQQFMDFIASKLGRSRVTAPPARPFRGAPDFWQSFEWPVEERIGKFTEHFRAAGGHVERLAGMGDAKAFIAGKAAEMGAKQSALPEARVSVWNEDSSEDWKARAAEADFGVVLADYAAAYTGSITVLSDKTKGRSVSLLPTVLMAIIPVERLKTRLGEILPEFDLMGRDRLPAGIHFISGPSRSADIPASYMRYL